MKQTVPIVSPDGLAKQTAAFREFNDGRYLKKDEASKGITDYNDLDNLPSIEGVEVKGAKTAHDYGLALESEIPSIAGLTTSDEVADAIADAVTGMESQLEDYATKDDISNLASKDELEGYATKSDISNLASRAELVDYATKNDIGGLASKSELSGYATTNDVDAAKSSIEAKLGTYATKESLESTKTELEGKFSSYATKNDLESTKTQLEGRFGDYATTEDLDSAIKTTESAFDGKLSNFATKETADNLSKRLDSEHPVGSEIVSKSAINPATLYGGTWQTDSTHLFRGVYVYRRTS